LGGEDRFVLLGRRARIELTQIGKEVRMAEINARSNEAVMEIGRELERLRQSLIQVRSQVGDVFDDFGPHAPFLRGVFEPVALPVQTPTELLEKMGGPDRIFVVPDMKGRPTAVAAADVVDTLAPFLSKFLPAESGLL
jgi:hypothetical protein